MADERGRAPRASREPSITTAPQAELSAAASARVEGRVADARPSGAAQRRQLFLVELPSRMRHYPVRTDEDGRFVFLAFAPGV